MLKLDNDLLNELGLGSLPEDQKRAMLQHIYDTLELRVGTNLANQMTDRQLEEFEKFIDDNGDANQDQALQWLEANLPHYKQVVNDVFEALKLEIKQMAPQILAASIPQQQPAVTPQAVATTTSQPQQPLTTQSNDVQARATDPLSQQPAIPSQSQQTQIQNAKVLQFPTQQPPAGPGNYQNRRAA
ncbi:MAG TPA: DUF5663 domain-containing protein [Verrucomicrobiae bacterium]|nr:DUF5663 domain-containing protein [Verrucomicrobiae bacterium]